MQKQGSFWLKAISQPGHVRCVIIQAPSLIEELGRIHHLSDEMTPALGEAVISALMLSSFCKGNERVNLTVQGDASIRQAFVDADPQGHVRGYLLLSDLSEVKSEENWGSGIFSVLRTQAEEGRQPYIGSVPLASQDLQECLSRYWNLSEQVVSAVAISRQARGGVLFQVLGGATPEEVSWVKGLESRLRAVVDEVISSQDPLACLSSLFTEREFVEIEVKPLTLKCSCSFEKVEKALMMIGEGELHSILKNEGCSSISCDFCGKKYTFDQAALLKILHRLQEKNQS